MASTFSGMEHFVRESELLAPYTWLRLGGPAQYFAEPTTIDELAELVRRCREQELPVRLLGGGSNILAPDQGVSGVVIHLSAPEFSRISVREQTLIAAGGAQLSHLISTAVREGLGGLETMAGVPGRVGGALHGNAYGHTGDIGQWTSRATVMTRDGEILTRSREEMHFAHQESSLDELVILDAEFALEPESPEELTRKLQKLWIVKRAAIPTSDQNTAALFKDHAGVSASSLIEQAGLKNAHLEEVEVCSNHPNFVIAGAGADSGQVLEMISMLQAGVKQKLGIELEPALDIWEA